MEDIRMIREGSRTFILHQSRNKFLRQTNWADLRHIAVDVAFTLEYYCKHRSWINRHLQEHNRFEMFHYLNNIAWKFTIHTSSTDDEDVSLVKTANAAPVVDVSKHEADGDEHEDASLSGSTQKIAELKSKSTNYISAQNILMNSIYTAAVIEIPAVSSALVNRTISYLVDNARELEHQSHALGVA